MEFSDPIGKGKDATSSPISKGSGLDSDGLPSLVDEDIQLKARITMLESDGLYGFCTYYPLLFSS